MEFDKETLFWMSGILVMIITIITVILITVFWK